MSARLGSLVFAHGSITKQDGEENGDEWGVWRTVGRLMGGAGRQSRQGSQGGCCRDRATRAKGTPWVPRPSAGHARRSRALMRIARQNRCQDDSEAERQDPGQAMPHFPRCSHHPQLARLCARMWIVVIFQYLCLGLQIRCTILRCRSDRIYGSIGPLASGSSSPSPGGTIVGARLVLPTKAFGPRRVPRLDEAQWQRSCAR
ncbi:hypothetical protein CC85DRAFT_151299 [Cutaneotrichosporon oleaginosum]|uniref:Uncharacterized protein n=1 Tax=Cutaneotrichosporon oleaginosum TaxID=879819 RepID=A0A0J1AYN1_9TREE|nr:uncharacterized protein CC85DRAFT_151299 [Cutaneotrichosporon oleaginosum]KLT40419.1 hypothetical protein CC85DRAFT_151299 [Cutaneotrichosporon oleaginosum]TXT11384.1 hypothetical protein COLE_01794 [Cutaneotrichosporon oleaginosum]